MTKKTTLLTVLCLSASISYSQSIEQIREANLYLQQNIDCQGILEKQDSIIEKLDSAKLDLSKKLEQSKTLDKIRADFENQMVKKQLETEQLAETQRKKKVRWRNFGIGAIIKDLATIAVIIINPLKL